MTTKQNGQTQKIVNVIGDSTRKIKKKREKEPCFGEKV